MMERKDYLKKLRKYLFVMLPKPEGEDAYGYYSELVEEEETDPAKRFGTPLEVARTLASQCDCRHSIRDGSRRLVAQTLIPERLVWTVLGWLTLLIAAVGLFFKTADHLVDVWLYLAIESLWWPGVFSCLAKALVAIIALMLALRHLPYLFIPKSVKKRRVRICKSSAILILLLLSSLVALLGARAYLAFATPVLFSMDEPTDELMWKRREVRFLISSSWSDGVKELYKSRPPRLADVDWSIRTDESDLAWLGYGLRVADKPSFLEIEQLQKRGLDDLTVEEIRLFVFYFSVCDPWQRTALEPLADSIITRYGFADSSQLMDFVPIWADRIPTSIQEELISNSLYYCQLYDSIERGEVMASSGNMPIETVCQGILREVPEWARDPSVVLSYNETLDLMVDAHTSGTGLKVLLPQFRDNVERHGIRLRRDMASLDKLIVSDYVRHRFEEMGLL